MAGSFGLLYHPSGMLPFATGLLGGKEGNLNAIKVI